MRAIGTDEPVSVGGRVQAQHPLEITEELGQALLAKHSGFSVDRRSVEVADENPVWHSLVNDLLLETQDAGVANRR